jgi:hypothetical protein
MAGRTTLPKSTLLFIEKNPDYTLSDLIFTYLCDIDVNKSVTVHQLYKIVKPYFPETLLESSVGARLSEIMSNPAMRNHVLEKVNTGINTHKNMYTRIHGNTSLPTLTQMHEFQKTQKLLGPYKHEQNKAMRECQRDNVFTKITQKTDNELLALSEKIKKSVKCIINEYYKDNNKHPSDTCITHIAILQIPKETAMSYMYLKELISVPSLYSRVLELCNAYGSDFIIMRENDFIIKVEPNKWGGLNAMSTNVNKYKKGLTATNKEKRQEIENQTSKGFNL